MTAYCYVIVLIVQLYYFSQQHQLDALKTLKKSPNRLLFYRTLLILIESVWVSVKAASGRFTQAGGDAGKSSTVANCAKAVKVLGAVLSLAPMGGIVKAAANAGASAMSSANDARQAQICAHLNRLVTLDEGKFIAHTVAWQLCETFAEQLEMLPKPPSVDRRKDSAGFMDYFKLVCGALGGAIADYNGIDEDDDNRADLMETVREQADEFVSGQVGIIVGDMEGPEPMAKVLAEFCFLWVSMALETTVPGESASVLATRLVGSVMCLQPADVRDPVANGSLEEKFSGARRLAKKFCRKARRMVEGTPNTSLSVFIGSGETWTEVSALDLLTRCGMRCVTGEKYLAPHSKPDVYGWCVGSQSWAGLRGLKTVSPASSTSSTPSVVVHISGVSPTAAAAQADLGRAAAANRQLLRPVSPMRSRSPSPRTSASSTANATTTKKRASKSKKSPRNAYNGRLWGACQHADHGICHKYVRPTRGANCGVCDCAVIKHEQLCSV
mmetsp:Transcript_5012/g.8104  ORF Transcript_5012/g.8104 Transcript_5012/m.8104 type:complete len:498 (+) Transcript_5012:953-2446(+)